MASVNAHQFTPGDFGTCRCGAGLGDPIHWGATTPADRIHAAYDAAVASDPVRTDDVLEARVTALRKALIACRALHTGAEFMKGEAQRVLWHVDAVIEETR